MHVVSCAECFAGSAVYQLAIRSPYMLRVCDFKGPSSDRGVGSFLFRSID